MLLAALALIALMQAAGAPASGASRDPIQLAGDCIVRAVAEYEPSGEGPEDIATASVARCGLEIDNDAVYEMTMLKQDATASDRTEQKIGARLRDLAVARVVLIRACRKTGCTP